MQIGVQVTQRVPEQVVIALKTCRMLTTLLIPSGHGINDLRGPSKGKRESPMASVLHQKMANRCGDKISRNGETGPGPCDRLKETEIILPFTHHPGPYQLSIKVRPSKARCFRSFVEVDN